MMGGTDAAESFASYYSRLAMIHGVSRTQLGTLLAKWWEQRTGEQISLAKFPLTGRFGLTIHGFGARVANLVQIVELATGVSCLKRSSLVPLRQNVAEQGRGLVGARRWCSQCFREDVRRDGVVFDRLLWTLAPYARCHIHRVALGCECPQCGSGQRWHASSGDPMLCIKCRSTLIEPGERLAPQLNPTFGEQDCIDLVSAIARGDLDELEPHRVFTFEEALDDMLSPLAGAVRGVSERSTRRGLKGGFQTPTLLSLLKKAYVAGIPLVGLLLDPVGSAKVAGNLLFDSLAMPLVSRTNYLEDMAELVREALSSALERPITEVGPSIREMSEELGVTESYMRRQQDRLCSSYRLHRERCMKHRAELHRAACSAEIVRIMKQEIKPDLASNKKLLERHLVSVTGCRNTLARGIIRAWYESDKGMEEVRASKPDPGCDEVGEIAAERVQLNYDRAVEHVEGCRSPNRILLDRLAERLKLSEQEIAESIGMTKQYLYRRLESEEVAQSLQLWCSILDQLANRHSIDELSLAFHVRNTPVSNCGHRTVFDVVRAGSGEEILKLIVKGQLW